MIRGYSLPAACLEGRTFLAVCSGTDKLRPHTEHFHIGFIPNGLLNTDTIKKLIALENCRLVKVDRQSLCVNRHGRQFVSSFPVCLCSPRPDKRLPRRFVPHLPDSLRGKKKTTCRAVFGCWKWSNVTVTYYPSRITTCVCVCVQPVGMCVCVYRGRSWTPRLALLIFFTNTLSALRV